jgi:SAM-dependent methyltransferase
VDHFVRADLDAGIPDAVGDEFDAVLMADVVEHVRRPENLLAESVQRLSRGGRLLASIPNFGHWYPRARTVVGRFDYDQRGILDRGHVRFFTKKSFENLVAGSGLKIRRRSATGLPLDVLRSDPSGIWSALEKADRAAVMLRPQIFAYQLLYELEA